MPKISVISIAKDESELNNLKTKLSKQSYKDFDFVISTKGTIPEAWNDAISKATGEYFVFTESDASPFSDSWLEEISSHLEKNTVKKGVEIRSTNLNMCNLIGDATIFKKHRFDESFSVAEDTELFARMKANGVNIEQVSSFPVVHTPSISWSKTLSRAFKYGHLYIKIMYMHKRTNMENVNTQRFNPNRIHPISNRIRIIVENILVLLGLLFGLLYHLPTLVKNR